jgi:16S rRNA processing protein rimM
MIQKSEITPIGTFQRTHALKGELNARLDIDGEFVEEGHPLVVEIDGLPVPFYAESVRPKGASTWLIKLDGIDSEEEARRMVNKTIYAFKDQVSVFAGEEISFVEDIIGYEMVDDTLGHIGVLEGVDDSTDNPLFVVRDDDGQEILIPLHEDFIEEIDDDGKVVRLDLPNGLLDINSKEP